MTAIEDSISKAVKAINDGTFQFEAIRRKETKKTSLCSSNNLATILVQRKINENIVRIYKVKQSNRRQIIQQIHALLEDGTPKYIIKIDIKSFYESINRKEAVKSITENSPLSLTTKRMIELLCNHHIIRSENGLPRGIGISASLSEYYMRSFDRKVSQLSGVYYYVRYVDDIIIFCYKWPDRVRSQVLGLLADYGLEANPEKSTDPLRIGSCICFDNCRCNETCSCKPKCKCGDIWKEHTSKADYNPFFSSGHKYEPKLLDYLGYRFSIPPITPSFRSNYKIGFSLSPKKVQRIKSRMNLSLLQYEKDKNFILLRDRIRYVMSNFNIRLSSKRGTRSGIYYNYPKLSDAGVHDLSLNVLRDLDRFKKFLFERSDLGKRVSAHLTYRQKRQLLRMSFVRGHCDKITYNFSRDKMQDIKRAWINEQN